MSPLRALIFSSMLAAGLAGAQEAARMPRVHDLATPFAALAERHPPAATAAFVREFKASIATRFPAFYGIERYEGEKSQAARDADIAAAHAQFPALREAYVAKVTRFTRDLPRHIASFQAVFPDYAANDIYFIHSLGEMDGGKRSFDGRAYFIFGADQMVKSHGDANEAAFFHHELFHDYHAIQCERQAIWVSLWIEGLATHVAQTLNPAATDAELLLHVPADLVPGTRRQLAHALDDLQVKLDKVDDREAYSGLFLRSGDRSGLPARRGYYLGYLVAREAATRHTLPQLAKLDCDGARAVVFAAVERLREQVPR